MITTINNAIAKKREEGEKGFTLIELLVVILIIGVLAAIAIPAFLNQRQGAWASQVENDIRNAITATEQIAVASNGGYPVEATAVDITGDARWTDAGFNRTPDVTVTYEGTATAYTLRGTHQNRGTDEWVYSSATGVTTKP